MGFLVQSVRTIKPPRQRPEPVGSVSVKRLLRYSMMSASSGTVCLLPVILVRGCAERDGAEVNKG
jgi:hypothetical protein